MGFHEVQFPTTISYGSSGGPVFSTGLVVVDSGAEERTARWSAARREYDVVETVKTDAQIAALITFFEARLGMAYGFRYKDFADFTTASDHIAAPDDEDQTLVGVTSGLTVGDGSETQFQLRKAYTSGAVTRYRNLTKPVADTTVIALDTVGQGSGWSVDTTTGIVTFTSAPGVGVAVTGGCEFDVPVRFDVDKLSVTIEDYGSRTIQTLPLVELFDETALADEFYYGDAYDHGTMAADVSMTTNTGRVQTVACNSTSYDMYLPSADDIPAGGPVFYVFNTGSADLEVKTTDETVVGTIGNNAGLDFFISKDSDGSKTWYAK